MEREKKYRLDVVSVRLVQDVPLYSEKKITTPTDAVQLIGEKLKDMDREVLCVIALKTDGTPINCNFASVGTLNYAVMNPREVFKALILSNAAHMILIHNHPSGKLTPSEEDIMLTDRMSRAAELIGIPLADHIIVGGNPAKFFSFRENNMVSPPPINYAKAPGEIDWGKEKAAERKRCR